MRLRSAFLTVLAALVITVTGGAAFAQGYIVVDPQTGAFRRVPGPPPGYAAPPPGYAQPQPQLAPPPQRRRSDYYPGMMVQPVPQPGFSLRRLFGFEDEPARLAPQAPRVRPRPAPPAAVARQKPKIDPSTHVVVFGDGLADLTGQGIDDAFAETPEVAVIRKIRGDSGLVRGDVDWPKYIQDVLGGGQKITLAVVMLGASDRQTIKEGDTSHEPLSDRWRELYRQRVDAVAKVFQDRSVPVVWIGLPPIKNDKLSADYIAMNEIIRESVQRLGGSYVDIWPGFVNDENRYTATGPDVNGQTSRLRPNDGVLFTKAGARKAAHFADTEIKRIIEAKRTGTAVTAAPNSDSAPTEASVDQVIRASLPALPELSGTPPLQAKPLAGPVLPLNKPDLSPGGKLVSDRPRLDNDAGYTIQKAFRQGVVSNPRPGRADDFRWPSQ
jgi:hypothetical protein